MFNDAGPTGIKLGQYLYHRPDIIDEQWRPQFRKMLDQNKPVHVHDLDLPPDLEVDPEPVGTGSLAQVHRGTYKSKRVIVKVLLPIARYTWLDMYVCWFIVRFFKLCGYFPLDWNAFAADMERQLDLRYEADDMEYTRLLFLARHAPMSETAADGRDRYDVRVPRTYSASKHVLVMEEALGVPLYRLPPSSPAHVERVRAFCYMATHGDHRFHADLHDGNLLFNTDRRELWLMDFGICAHPTVDWVFPLPLLARRASPTYHEDLLRALCGPRTDYAALGQQLARTFAQRHKTAGSVMCDFFRFLHTHDLTLSGAHISCFSQLVALETTVPNIMEVLE
jgi:predicted unusual protein kinase regulating ubiquinone biosynthesis (AarF/ABC1/UbiB family)